MVLPFATGTKSDYEDFRDINKDIFTQNRCNFLVVLVWFANSFEKWITNKRFTLTLFFARFFK